jgi:hypothetical protein
MRSSAGYDGEIHADDQKYWDIARELAGEAVRLCHGDTQQRTSQRRGDRNTDRVQWQEDAKRDGDRQQWQHVRVVLGYVPLIPIPLGTSRNAVECTAF